MKALAPHYLVDAGPLIALFARIRVKAEEIIAEIKGLPPEGLAEISAFMMQSEQVDPALRIALQRKHSSTTGQVVSRPYEQAKAAVRAALNPAQ